MRGAAVNLVLSSTGCTCERTLDFLCLDEGICISLQDVCKLDSIELCEVSYCPSESMRTNIDGSLLSVEIHISVNFVHILALVEVCRSVERL